MGEANVAMCECVWLAMGQTRRVADPLLGQEGKISVPTSALFLLPMLWIGLGRVSQARAGGGAQKVLRVSGIQKFCSFEGKGL